MCHTFFGHICVLWIAHKSHKDYCRYKTVLLINFFSFLFIAYSV